MTDFQNPPLKKPLLGDFEDVISMAALLRPTIVKAVAQLPTDVVASFRDLVIEAERELANSRLEFRERFQRAQTVLQSTYVYAPEWRFIAGRIEDTWTSARTLTLKELSIVSLLFGIMLEEAQARLSKKSKKSA